MVLYFQQKSSSYLFIAVEIIFFIFRTLHFEQLLEK